MIRHLHPTDSPALLPFKQRSGPDEVCSLAQAVKGGRRSFPLFKYTSIALSPRAWQSCWVMTRRAAVQAVMRAGSRSGPFAWELSELYLAKKNREVAGEVLEQLAFPAGTSGARRIFLRLRQGSELFEAARSAGYMPAYSETLYRAESAEEVISPTADAPELELKPLEETDQHALFRLYCSAVPIDVRSKTGQTLDEWSSSLEHPARKQRQLGVEDQRNGALQAEITLGEVAGGRYFSILSSKDASLDTGDLIASALKDASDKPALTMVPSYNEKLAGALAEIGFTAGDSYDVMVKTLAVPVTETVPGLARLAR